MSGHEWKTLLGFGALTVAVSLFDRRAGLWLVALVAIVTVVKHPAAINRVFGGVNAATGG